MRYLIVPFAFLLLCLTGCVADQNNRQANENNQTGPVVNVPAPRLVPEAELEKSRADNREATHAAVDKAKTELRQEMQTSSNNTQNQLSGLVNASVSKVAEKLTGVEADLHVNAENTMKLADKLNTTVTANAVLETKVGFQNEMIANLKIQLQQQIDIKNEMKLELDRLNAQVQGVLGAQAGINNKIETISTNATNTAGRDVNYLPKEAVELFTALLTCVFGIGVLAIGWIGRNSRLRERAHTLEEKDERQKSQEILYYVLSLLPEAKSADVNMAQARIEQKPRTRGHGYGWWGNLMNWWHTG